MAISKRNNIPITIANLFNGKSSIGFINAIAIAAAAGGITFVDSATNNFGATTSPTVNYPAGMVVNDIIFMAVATDTVHTSTETPPAGWFKIAEQPAGTTSDLSVYWRRVDGTEGSSQSWTNLFDANETGTNCTVVYRGCVTTGDPQDTTFQSGTSSGSTNAQSIDTVTDGAMVVAFFGTDPAFNPLTFTWDSPINPRIVAQNGTVGWISVADIIKDIAGTQNMQGSFGGATATAKIVIALRAA